MSGLALFGGTFDPIHNAHLQIAQAAADRCGLERVLFIPSGNPPHRAEGPFASYESRYQMVALACQDDARFEASRLEEGTRKNYSIDTIRKVRELTSDTLYFVIGADAFAEIRTWRDWMDVIEAVTFIVVSRPGSHYDVPEAAQVIRLDDLELLVSSSRIREQLSVGTAPDGLPATVAAYIEAHGLYRSRMRK